MAPNTAAPASKVGCSTGSATSVPSITTVPTAAMTHSPTPAIWMTARHRGTSARCRSAWAMTSAAAPTSAARTIRSPGSTDGAGGRVSANQTAAATGATGATGPSHDARTSGDRVPVTRARP